MDKKIKVVAQPHDFDFEPDASALMIIDMQNDFVKTGLGDLEGHDVSLLQMVVKPLRKVLEAARAAGIKVVHTRQGYRPDLADYPFRGRGRAKVGGIGAEGPMGRILVRGQKGHEIIDELTPLEDEIVVDKHGHSAFYATDLEIILRNWGVKYLIVTGVTTDVCVHSTVREASDRGYECLVLRDCVASYNPKFHEVGLEMISAQGGLFGRVSSSENFIRAISGLKKAIS